MLHDKSFTSWQIEFLVFVCFNSLFYLHAQCQDSLRTFATQYFHNRYTLTLNTSGNTITGERNQEKISSGIMESSVFIQTDVIVKPLNGKSCQLSPRDTNTWFIPIDLGKAPFKISQGNCIKMSSFLKSVYQECPASTLLYLPDRIIFIGGIDAKCEKSNICEIVYIPCDSLYGYDFFSGGVIVQADTVLISDPEWYIPNHQPPIIFKEDENGHFIRVPHKEKKD